MTALGRLYRTVRRAPDRAPEFLSAIQFRVAETRDELKAAAHLTYREYLKRGYVTPSDNQLKLSIFHALPETTMFIAVHPSRGVIGTVTLIQDSPLGLPIDEIYRSELDVVRARGHRLAEACMFTWDTTLFSRSGLPRFRTTQLLLTLQLFKLLFDYVRCATEITELVACFHPRHRVLYDFLHFRSLGGLTSYARVNDHPAVAGHLRVAETEQLARSFRVMRFFWEPRYSAETYLNKLRLSLEDLQDLFVRSSSILASASRAELAYLQRCYPAEVFAGLLRAFMPETLSDVEIASA